MILEQPLSVEQNVTVVKNCFKDYEEHNNLYHHPDISSN